MFNPFRREPNLKDEPTSDTGKGRTPIKEEINMTIEPRAPHEGEKPGLVIGPAGQGGEKKE